MKIAIVRIDRMGDMILTLPVIKSLKLCNPEAEIHVYGSNKNIKILKSFKYVSKFYNINEKQKFNQKYDLTLNSTGICSTV